MKRSITLGHENGDIEITEDQLATISDADLKFLKLSRDDLHPVFAEGQRLMMKHKVVEADRKRPIAERTLDGLWLVGLARYSSLSDPLMQGAHDQEARSLSLMGSWPAHFPLGNSLSRM